MFLNRPLSLKMTLEDRIWFYALSVAIAASFDQCWDKISWGYLQMPFGSIPNQHI